MARPRESLPWDGAGTLTRDTLSGNMALEDGVGSKNLGAVPLTNGTVVSNTAQVSGGRSNSGVVLLSYTTVASNATGLWTIDAQPGAVILTGAIVARRGYHGGSGLVGPGMGSRGEGDG